MTAGVADDPKPSTTIFVGIVGAILLLAVVLAAIVVFGYAERDQTQRKLYAVLPRERLDLEARQIAQISTYRYVDRENGVVAIPIDEAIPLFVKELNAGSASTAGAYDSGQQPARTETP